MLRRSVRTLGAALLAQALLWGLGLAVAGCAARATAGPALSAESSPTGTSVRRETGAMFTYHYLDVPYKPYVEQLCTPAGVNVVRDSPSDHKHHHGLMFALSAEDVDFWSEEGQPGRQVNRKLSGPVFPQPNDVAVGVLSEQLDWLGSGDQVLLTEERTLQTYAGAGIDATLLTWRSRLTPAAGKTSVTLSGAHYVGLGMRFPASLDKTTTFLNASGQPGEIVRGDERVVRANWSACTGDVDGHPVTVAMFDDPNNLRSPAAWFTMAKPFAYLSATMDLHREPFVLTARKPLLLRYAVAVWDVKADAKLVEQLYHQWLSPCSPTASKGNN
jgi:hypothetical protein